MHIQYSPDKLTHARPEENNKINVVSYKSVMPYSVSGWEWVNLLKLKAFHLLLNDSLLIDKSLTPAKVGSFPVNAHFYRMSILCRIQRKVKTKIEDTSFVNESKYVSYADNND